MSYIKGLSSSFPKNCYKQSEILELSKKVFGHRNDFSRMIKVYNNSGVKSRFLVNKLSWYKKNHGWKERNFYFKKNSLLLLKSCISETLTKLKINSKAIGGIIVVNTTGIATPSLDAELINFFDFNRSIKRLPIFGYGCAGGVLGLCRGKEMHESIGKPVLVCNVELCSLTFRSQNTDNQNIVSTALFGDGASSYIVDKDGNCKILKNMEYTWRNSLDLMGWNVENDGLGVIFDKNIAKFVKEKLPEIIKKFFPGEKDGFILHSGGMKIIEAYKEIFNNHKSIKISEGVLSDYGNISSVSVLVVLQRILEKKSKGNFLMSAMGPGFSAGICEMKIHE